MTLEEKFEVLQQNGWRWRQRDEAWFDTEARRAKKEALRATAGASFPPTETTPLNSETNAAKSAPRFLNFKARASNLETRRV